MKRRLHLLMLCTLGTGTLLADESETAALTFASLQQRYIGATIDQQEGRLSAAKASLISLKEDLSQVDNSRRHIAEIDLRLARIEMEMDQPEEALDIALGVLNQSLPDDLLLRAGLLVAELHSEQGDLIRSYRILQALEGRIASREWPADARNFYDKTREQLDKRNRQQWTHAERLFNSQFYQEAAPLFRDVYTAARQGLYPEIGSDSKRRERIIQFKYRLAQTLYLAQDYQAAVEVLEEKLPVNEKDALHYSSTIGELEASQVFLRALCYRQLGQYQQAIRTFKLYLTDSSTARLKKHDEVQWELGLCHYHLKAYSEARGYLETLDNKYAAPSLQQRASLYLARIDIAEDSTQQALARLQKLANQVNAADPLRCEIQFLRGQIAFDQKDYASAIHLYEQAIPQRTTSQATWVPEARYQLGQSYWKLSQTKGFDSSSASELLSLAEAALLPLTKQANPLFEDALLSVGRIHLQRYELTGDHKELEAVETLLTAPTIRSPNLKVRALLLRSLASLTYSHRASLLEEASALAESTSKYQGEVWYQRGLNDLNEAQTTGNMKLLAQAASHFEQAVHSSASGSVAAEAILQQAECLHRLGRNEEACNQLTSLIAQPRLLEGMDSPARVYLLMGETGLLAAEQSGGPQRDIAERALAQVVDQYPRSSYAPIALHRLASSHFANGKYNEAQQLYLKVVEDYPHADVAGACCFWASECCSWLGEDADTQRRLRERVYLRYPNCEYAAEAFLRSFSFSDYLAGDEYAMSHLQRMPSMFPGSPLLVQAHYLIGLDRRRDRLGASGEVTRPKNRKAAVDAFDAGYEIYRQALHQNTIPERHASLLTTMGHRCQLEAALTNIATAREAEGAKKQIYLEYARSTLESLIGSLEHRENNLLTGSALEDMVVEANFTLAQCHIENRDDKKAEAILNALVERHTSQGIRHGYYLSRAWVELGNIATRQADYKLAVEFYDGAMLAAQGDVLNAEQRLDLWTKKGAALKEMGMLEDAMTVLSQVVNDPAISSTRLRAMYLRAEIYQLQGRHDLAVKQLEATASKGGEWALKAQETLESNYGYR